MATAQQQAKHRRAVRANGGRPLTTSSLEAAVRLRSLRKMGMGTRVMAERSGVDRHVIQQVLTDPSRTIYVSTHSRLMALDLDVADGARIPAVGTQRRLGALMHAGWSLSALERLRGHAGRNLYKVMQQRVVTQSMADEIEQLFRQLDGKTPPMSTRGERSAAGRTKSYAQAKGYVPASAWDDIDDPKERPKGVRAS